MLMCGGGVSASGQSPGSVADEDQDHMTKREHETMWIARIYDVPPWVVSSEYRRPRFARVRWMLRRVWPQAVWK